MQTLAAPVRPNAAKIPGAFVETKKPPAPIAPLPGALAGLGIASAAAATITPAALVQSQSFLSAQQATALQRLQQEQQAQQTLNSVLGGKKPAAPARPAAPQPGK